MADTNALLDGKSILFVEASGAYSEARNGAIIAAAAVVILSVIPPGATSKTGGDLADGTTDLTCKDGT